jgi:hypothetical protein
MLAHLGGLSTPRRAREHPKNIIHAALYSNSMIYSTAAAAACLPAINQPGSRNDQSTYILYIIHLYVLQLLAVYVCIII